MKHEQYLRDRGWSPWNPEGNLRTSGAKSYWVSPHSGKIYVRRFAVQIQRGMDKREMEA